ncbi:MAG: glycosyltransferase family 2 protein [Planctomycetota bacterium]
MAVVLNWNGGEETLDCLRALVRAEHPAPLPLLADNGSLDGSVERALAEFPGLEVLRFGQNLGYAAGNNRAIAHAFESLGADWVCLLNSDLVVAPDTFARMLRAVDVVEGAATQPSTATPLGADTRPGDAGEGAVRIPVGVVGPCLLYRDRPDVVWACGGRIGGQLNVTQLIGHGGPRRADAPRPVDYVPGTCLMLSRLAWERTGPLDESFFCYLEDADWCLRVRQAGLAVIVAPEATAWHGLSTSTGGGYTAGRKYMTAVNSVHFLRKHGGAAGWTALFVFDLLLWPLAWARALLAGRAGSAVAKLRGVIDGLRGLRVTADVAARFARKAP